MNMIGEIIEESEPFYYTKAKQDNPENVEERSYHAATRALILNEIFRRVEPQGRTMAEFLRDEFPGVGVYSGIQDQSVMNRVQDLKEMPEGVFEQSAYYT